MSTIASLIEEKKQLFLDGNKRTAVLFANHILISHGKGLIVIPSEKVENQTSLHGFTLSFLYFYQYFSRLSGSRRKS